MSKFFDVANEQKVICYIVYINDGKIYNNADFTDQIQTSDLALAFKKNVVVDVDGALYTALSYSETDGVGTLGYASIDDGAITVATAVSRADIPTSKEVVDVRPEDPVNSLFGGRIAKLQTIKVENGKITGTLRNFTEECELTNYWGTGNFFALKFSADDMNAIEKIEVGFPEGTGLTPLDSDMNGVWKVTKESLSRKFVVKTTFKNGNVNTQVFDISGLELVS